MRLPTARSADSSWQATFLALALATLVLTCFSCLAEASASASPSSTPNYLILDSSHDAPHIYAALMALDAHLDPANDAVLLGAVTTTSPDTRAVREILERTHLAPCFELLEAREMDLILPPEGLPEHSSDEARAKQRAKAPESVRFLVDSVAMHPGQVTIYCSGSLASVAYAAQLDPSFVRNVKEVVVVGKLDHAHNTYLEDGKTIISAESPFLRDFEAFLSLFEEDGSISSRFRLLATLEPLYSGHEVATAVMQQVEADLGGKDEREWRKKRKFTMIYLDYHYKLIKKGSPHTLLLQEPGLAMILYPSVVAEEDPITFSLEEGPEDPELEYLAATKLTDTDNQDIDGNSSSPAASASASARSSLIHHLHEDKLKELLVRIRSRDWRRACPAAADAEEAQERKEQQQEEEEAEAKQQAKMAEAAAAAAAPADDSGHDEL